MVQFSVSLTANNTEAMVMWSPPLQANGIITAYEVIMSLYQEKKGNNITVQHVRLERTDKSYTLWHLSECKNVAQFMSYFHHRTRYSLSSEGSGIHQCWYGSIE